MSTNDNSFKEVMLTTIDNPFDPFTHFDEWFQFDVEQGYNSCGLLARISKTSKDLSESEYNDEIERSINEIIKNDPLGLYCKAYPGMITHAVSIE